MDSFLLTKSGECRFGPRESKKAEVFSDIGRLNCDVKFASFATSVRGRASQVDSILQFRTYYLPSDWSASDIFV